MPYYLTQIAYASKGFAALIRKPQDRMEALQPLFENLGGSIQGMWFAFGEYDLVLISQLPDNSSVAAISMAISSGDSVKTVKTTPLMTMDEGIDSMKKTAKAGYQPPQAILI